MPAEPGVVAQQAWNFRTHDVLILLFMVLMIANVPLSLICGLAADNVCSAPPYFCMIPVAIAGCAFVSLFVGYVLRNK